MKKQPLIMELVLLFFLFPAVLSALKPHGVMYFCLWITFLGCVYWLKKHHNYTFKKDWNGAAVTLIHLKPMLMRFLFFGSALFLFIVWDSPERLFYLPRNKPGLWVMVMFFYPLLSVVPQEIIFRSFFLRRYAPLMPMNRLYIVNALAFGWMHILLQNWVAIVFSGIGGYMFARTYKKSDSLALACLEHALYGCTIFTIGLGFYFYHGTAVK